jgi:hypothetical protein
MRKTQFVSLFRFFALTLLIQLLISCVAFSQVTIKERVQIAPGTISTRRGHSPLDHTTSYVVTPGFFGNQQSGTMALFLNLSRWKAMPPANAYIVVRHHDTTYTLSAPNYAPITSSGWSWYADYCTGNTDEVDSIFSLQWDPRKRLSAFIPNVRVGDSLFSTYYGTGVAPLSHVDPYGTSADLVMTYAYDSHCYPSGDSEIIGETGVIYLEPAPSGFTGFRVITGADTLSILDTTSIRVVAINSDSSEVPLDPNTLITFSLDSTRLGSFIDPLGNVVSSLLSNVKYSDARVGNVRFLPTIVQDTATVKGFSIMVAGSQKTGSHKVYVRDMIELILVDPKEGSTFTGTISSVPAMPALIAKAKIIGRGTSTAVYNWKFSLRWDHHTSTTTFAPLVDTFLQTITVNSADSCVWPILWDTKTRGGWLDTLFVSVTCRGKTVKTQRNNPYRILGLNTDRTTMRTNLNTEMQVILYKEDWPGRRFLHFQADSTPSYGSPSGYGVAKLDPPPDPQQYWNWVSNKAGGVARFGSAQNSAATYGARVKAGTSFREWYHGRKYAGASDLSFDQQVYDSFQMYNGYHYWRWFPNDPNVPSGSGQWRKSDHHAYGDDAYTIRQSILLFGQYPSDWNN